MLERDETKRYVQRMVNGSRPTRQSKSFEAGIQHVVHPSESPPEKIKIFTVSAPNEQPVRLSSSLDALLVVHPPATHYPRVLRIALIHNRLDQRSSVK